MQTKKDAQRPTLAELFDIPPLRFFDQVTNREMCYVYPDTKHYAAGWLLYKHPDGQWVTLRKATEDDLTRINKAVVASHHGLR